MSESMILEQLTQLEPDWPDVRRRSQRLGRQSLRRQGVLVLGVLGAAAALAGGAYAAVRIWSGHDMTPAAIEQQATTVSNDTWSVCDGQGHCTNETGTHTEVTILPSMGVTFVLPDGDATVIVPAAQIWNIPAAGGPPGMPQDKPLHDNSGNTWGTAHPLRDPAGNWIGGVWSTPLSGGGTRTIEWRTATGAMTVTDSSGGHTVTTRLHAGDVVPLVPGSLAGQPRTLDKAVTFDLPSVGRVIIFPQLNETYLNDVNAPPMSEPLPYGAAAKYGLTPIGDYNGKVPVTPSGGSWTAHLPNGLTRTISWHAGDSFVSVQDTTPSGTTNTRVPIGHELPLVPFK